MIPDLLDERDQIVAGGRKISELCDMAARGLRPMLDGERQVFSHNYQQVVGGLVRVGLSPRYTMMALLGLHRYEAGGQMSPIAIGPVLENLMQAPAQIEGAGDLGLLLWTCAELAPEYIPQVYQEIQIQDGLTRFSDGRLGSTMEVAWYLTGLTSCQQAGYGDMPGLRQQSQSAKQILKRNCGAAGVYGHRSRSKPPAGYLRRRIGSFADQVYPTIALARLFRATGDHEAREMALRTATTMCELQGPLGEWFWHYDAATAKVVNRYPVFSVHQHAMGPMMLLAVTEATGISFADSLDRSVAWISGKNELGRSMIEPELNLVWRCLYLRPPHNYVDAGLRILGLRDGASKAGLAIRHECRPYELGWLLYAFAARQA